MIKVTAKKLLCRKVFAGPFEGMAYVGVTACDCLFPKILGTYERELARCVQRIIGEENPVVIDVGAAEGYYAVGILYKNPGAKVIAFEASATARLLLAKLAACNGVADRLMIRGECSSHSLREELDRTSATTIIMDVEGAELELLDPEYIPKIKNVNILVELHDWVSPQLQPTLCKRFRDTHQFEEIKARIPAATDIQTRFYRSLAKLSPSIERRLLHERPPGMRWFIMRPNHRC